MNLDTSFNKEALGSQLRAVVRAGEMASALDLLKKGVPVDVRDDEGNTPLMLAVKNRNVLMAGLLLSFGAELDATNKAGMTPLWLATRSMTIIGKPDQGHTAASQAKAGGEVVELLLGFDADPMLVKDADYREILIAPLVIKLGKTKALRDMLEAGMKANLMNGRNESLLIQAAEKGDFGAVELLVEHGANFNHKDLSGRSVLRAAMQSENADIVKFLLDKGADTSAPAGSWPYSDMEFAERQGDEIAAAVKAASAKFELHKAVTDGDMEKLAQLLEQKDLPVDFYDSKGMTALMHAVAHKRPDAVRLLLDAGADPNLPRRDQRFPVPVQTSAGVKFADIPGAVDKAVEGGHGNYDYPLHTAVLNNDIESVRHLVRSGARTDMQDSAGVDVLRSAEGWLKTADAGDRADRALIVKVVGKQRALELDQMARSATRLKAPTQGLKRPTFGRKGAAP